MTTTYASVQIIANGQPYIFTLDQTDAATAANMVNVVSNRDLGSTFPSGATITHVGPCTLNSSGDAAGASKSELGAVIVDPQNNVVYQVPYVDPETAPIDPMHMAQIPVGLNYQMTIITANA